MSPIVMRCSNAPLVALGALAVCVACERKDAQPSDPGPSVIPPSSASASTVPARPSVVKPPKLTFEQMVAKSQPLAPTPEPQTDGGKKLVAERCSFQGNEFLGKSTLDVFKAIEVVDKRLLLVDRVGAIHGFSIDTKKECTLAVDKSFGTEGVLKLPEKTEHLSRTNNGRVFASNGIFAAHALKDGAREFECDTKGHVEMHPSGKWGIAPWVNANVRMVKIDGQACSSEDWVLKELNDDKLREGPFSNVNSSAVMGDRILIGGVIAKKVDPNQPRVVIVYDKAGKELLRFGGTPGEKDALGWVHAVEPCRSGICVLDSNLRRLTLWSRAGKHLSTIELTQLFGLEAPSVPDFTVAKDGSGWFAAAQMRGSSGVAEGLVYRVRGL